MIKFTYAIRGISSSIIMNARELNALFRAISSRNNYRNTFVAVSTGELWLYFHSGANKL